MLAVIGLTPSYSKFCKQVLNSYQSTYHTRQHIRRTPTSAEHIQEKVFSVLVYNPLSEILKSETYAEGRASVIWTVWHANSWNESSWIWVWHGRTTYPKVYTVALLLSNLTRPLIKIINSGLAIQQCSFQITIISTKQSSTSKIYL